MNLFTIKKAICLPQRGETSTQVTEVPASTDEAYKELDKIYNPNGTNL